MRLAFAALVLAGCDGVFGLTHIYGDSDAGGGDGSGDGGGSSCFREEFAGGDTGLLLNWDRYADNANVGISLDNAQLVLWLGANTGYAGIVTQRNVDFTGATVTIEVVANVTQDNTEAFIAIKDDRYNYYYFDLGAGYLDMRQRVAGSDVGTLGGVPFDPVAHRFLRMSHDPAAHMMRFSTGVDGVNFTERRALATTVPVSGVYIEVAAGAYGSGISSRTEARFDNFSLCVP